LAVIPKIPVPKLKVLKDPSVLGNTTLGGGINSGLLQDPGVPGQVLGDYSPIPTVPKLTGGTTGAPAPAPTPKSNPTYWDILTGDPQYTDVTNAYNTANQNALDSFRSQLKSAVIQSGYVPSMTGDLAAYADDLDSATLAAAQGNQMSQKAQLDKNYNQQLSNLSYALAGRGIGSGVRGGAQLAGSGNLKDQYDVQSYQGAQSLLNALETNAQNYNASKQGLYDNYQNALNQIGTRLASTGDTTYADTPGTTPAATTPTTPNVPSSQGVSWGGQTFTSRAALSNWLSAHGTNYKTWAANHPSAALQLS
jgi:hypothetical protein